MCSFIFVIMLVGSIIASTINPINMVVAQGGSKSSSLNMLAIGDSVMWGQGLREQEKFHSLVQKEIQSKLGVPVSKTVLAHSGAIIGGGYEYKFDWNQVPGSDTNRFKSFASQKYTDPIRGPIRALLDKIPKSIVDKIVKPLDINRAQIQKIDNDRTIAIQPQCAKIFLNEACTQLLTVLDNTKTSVTMKLNVKATIGTIKFERTSDIGKFTTRTEGGGKLIPTLPFIK